MHALSLIKGQSNMQRKTKANDASEIASASWQNCRTQHTRAEVYTAVSPAVQHAEQELSRAE